MSNEVNSKNACSESHESKKKFEHFFSGYSVWVEPCETSCVEMDAEMKALAKKCGGPSRGVHEFAPHCTLLYNINLDHFDLHEGEDIHSKGEYYLKKSIEIYRGKILQVLQESVSAVEPSDSREHDKANKTTMNVTLDNQIFNFNLVPSSLYYFPYPKTADEGRGFGCVILLLLLQDVDPNSNSSDVASSIPDTKKEPKLDYLRILHQSVTSVFPPDERHGEASGKFIPHMSLVYAPESETWLEDLISKGPTQNNEKNGHVQEKQKEDRFSLDQHKYNGNNGFNSTSHLLKELPAKFLTLWKTEGPICDWYKIAQTQII